jgi:hypothetical protein
MMRKHKQHVTAGWTKAEKSADGKQGIVTVAFAQLDVMDSDRDYTPSGVGVIDGNPSVKACQWGHQWYALPAGTGKVAEQDGWLVAELHYFLDTPQGAAEYATQKALADAGESSEWSYGYDVLDASMEVIDGERMQVLKKLHIFEVSPVLRGAGVGTHTLAVKSDDACATCGHTAAAKADDSADDTTCPDCDKPLEDCTCGADEPKDNLGDADAKGRASRAVAAYEVTRAMDTLHELGDAA